MSPPPHNLKRSTDIKTKVTLGWEARVIYNNR